MTSAIKLISLIFHNIEKVKIEENSINLFRLYAIVFKIISKFQKPRYMIEELLIRACSKYQVDSFKIVGVIALNRSKTATFHVISALCHDFPNFIF